VLVSEQTLADSVSSVERGDSDAALSRAKIHLDIQLSREKTAKLATVGVFSGLGFIIMHYPISR